MVSGQDSGDVLREEILVEARQKAEEIVLRARRDAERLLAAAEAEADKVRAEALDGARAEATRRRELILATVPVEAGRMRVARVEAFLESVREEARRRLLARDGFDYREAIVTLAALAASRMSGAAFVARVSEADRAFLGDGLADEVMRRVGCSPVNVSLTYDPEVTGAGVIVEDDETRQIWDNRLLQRLERMWPELRRQIAVKVSFASKTEPGGNAP